jgi:hypothetical protein
LDGLVTSLVQTYFNVRVWRLLRMASSLPAVLPGPTVTNVFGVLAAGRHVLTNFTQTNATPGAEKFVIMLENPSTVAELSVFLLPGIVLPPDKGVVIYWAVPPFTGWASFGALHAGKWYPVSGRFVSQCPRGRHVA